MVTNDKISVGPPFYNMTFVPILTPLLLAVVVGPVLKWKRDDLRPALERLRRPAVAAVAVFLLVLVATLGRGAVTAFFMGLAVWLVAGSFAMLGPPHPAGQGRPLACPASGAHDATRVLGASPRACRSRRDGCRHRRHVVVGDRDQQDAAAR